MKDAIIDLFFIAAPAVYAILTFIAILSLFSPLLSQLASHGKTRIQLHVRNTEDKKVTQVGIKSHHGESNPLFAWINHPRLQTSKRNFVHFYSVGILWTAMLHYVMKDADNNYKTSSKSRIIDIPLSNVMLGIHLIRRLFECLYVHQWKGTMHIAGFLLGLVHYLLLPFIFLFDPYSTSIKGKYTLDGGWESTAWILFGATMNLYAQYEQYMHHCLLAKCRTKKKCDKRCNSQSMESSYSIPRGKWFEYVSCPHYLGEILIYISFAILLHPHMADSKSGTIAEMVDDEKKIDLGLRYGQFLPIFLFLRPYKHIIMAVWVIVNLSVSARSSHVWYKEQFSDYPLQRAALIPFIW